MPSWLKKIGSVAIQVGKIIPGISPFATIAGALIPGDRDDVIIARATTTLDQIAGIIITAERMGQAIAAPGADKLKMATPEMVQLLLQSSLLAGKEIADSVKFQSGAVKMADGMAEILNSLKAEPTPPA